MTETFDLVRVQRLLARTPTTVRDLLTGLPPGAMQFREAPDSWTPLEILGHLADGEILDWIPRVEIILSAAEPKAFQPFDREGGLNRYRGWTVEALLDEFARLRSQNVATLAELRLTPAQLQAQGTHPELGRVTLEQLLATWITHDLAHVAQISRVLVRYFGCHVGPWTAYFSLLRDRTAAAASAAAPEEAR